ncbi:hypothetical protein [Clostridium sp.]|uniref:hypothetical protein n=1 Tax=Clostridium sp. TaxID=1506 RepID=UPI003D6D7868
MLESKNFYIIKQTDGTLWNFTFKDNFGIIYRTFEKNSWTNYNILVKNASKSFSALILPDNRICIIYQSSSGNLLLKVYSGNEWTEHSILHKKVNSVSDIHFKTMYVSGKIQIFYSILQSHDNIRTLFYQTLTLNKDLVVSSPVLIDTTNVNHVNQFVVHALEDNTICIMYQKLVNKYELGYKILNHSSANWSKFFNVDKNISPYIDYSLCSVNNKLNILYIKNNGQTSALYNVRNYISNPEHTKISESNNLTSCAFFKEGNITYGFWISNNCIYTYYTSGMGDSISPIKSEGLKSINIIKSAFIEILADRQCISNELYVQDGGVLTILPNNFFNYKHTLAEQNKLSNHFNTNTVQESIPSNTEENVASIEIKLIKKDQLINQLNYIIKEEKNKVVLLNNKISILEKNYLQEEDQKSQLYKDISLLQETLISKETQIHELEKIMIQKEAELMELSKNNNNNAEGQITKNAAMQNEIDGYKIMITNLNRIIEGLNSKIGLREDEIVEMTNEKNTSLFKKLFGQQ